MERTAAELNRANGRMADDLMKSATARLADISQPVAETARQADDFVHASPWAWSDVVSSWSWSGHEGTPARVVVVQACCHAAPEAFCATARRRAATVTDPSPRRR